MQQITPAQKVPIVYQIDRASIDTDTYYVQAIVRDTVNGTTIKTVNLTDGGNQRFTGTFEAPNEGQEEFFIDVETIVYTDSGYTTKSQSDAVQTKQYVVREAWSRALGSVGGSSIDYARIERIVDAVITKKLKEFKIPKTNLSPIVTLLKETKRAVNKIEIPETDLTNITNQLASITSLIENLPEETDLNPVLEGIQNLATTLGVIQDAISQLPPEVREQVNAAITQITGSLSEAQKLLSGEVGKIMEQIDKKEMNVGALSLAIPAGGGNEKPQPVRSSLLGG